MAFSGEVHYQSGGSALWRRAIPKQGFNCRSHQHLILPEEVLEGNTHLSPSIRSTCFIQNLFPLGEQLSLTRQVLVACTMLPLLHFLLMKLVICLHSNHSRFNSSSASISASWDGLTCWVTPTLILGIWHSGHYIFSEYGCFNCSFAVKYGWKVPKDVLIDHLGARSVILQLHYLMIALCSPDDHYSCQGSDSCPCLLISWHEDPEVTE